MMEQKFRNISARWVAEWVMHTWIETSTFRGHLQSEATGYPTEAEAIRMAGEQPNSIENSAGGEDHWTLQTLNLSLCYLENGHWYATE